MSLVLFALFDAWPFLFFATAAAHGAQLFEARAIDALDFGDRVRAVRDLVFAACLLFSEGLREVLAVLV